MKYTFKNEDRKCYPHFDAPLAVTEINKLVSNPVRVAKHQFFPFLTFESKWQPYRLLDSGKPDVKSRPIKYAARQDAYIFKYYREILSELYEQKLSQLGINECPIAYRKIPKRTGNGNKCSIDFAKDAFDEIKRKKNCVAVALDIKGFFENLDHSIIYDKWCGLLGVSRLENDHYNVFKNITRYHVVDRDIAYHRLGHTVSMKEGSTLVRKSKPMNEIPIQLCTIEEFREKICGSTKKYSSLVNCNPQKGRGIPQGAPISDLIANFYLLDFDFTLNQYAIDRGGKYMRYSDDILLILPGGKNEAESATYFVENEIKKHGNSLIIKSQKTCIVQFITDKNGLSIVPIKGESGKNGFEYLGFRFDGKRVYVRNSTISAFNRKVSKSAKRFAYKAVDKNTGNPTNSIISNLDYSKFYEKFGRVRKKRFNPQNFKTLTFYSYLIKSSKTFGGMGDQIPKQMRNFKKNSKNRINDWIRK